MATQCQSQTQRQLPLALTETRLARIERISGLAKRTAADRTDTTFSEANQWRAEAIARAECSAEHC